MRQSDLYEHLEPETRPELPEPTYHRYRPCPGCGAKAGTYNPSKRWRWLLGTSLLCEECGNDREVLEMHLRDDRPAPTCHCSHAPGSNEKIAVMTERAAAGLSIFQVFDNTWDPAPFKALTGPPDKWHDPGETGVEKCGTRWRTRPFWRGRKWSLGVFDTEAEAIGRARDFWKLHTGDDRPAPLLWLPTGDEDGAIAIEPEHPEAFRVEMGMIGLTKRSALRIARKYRGELRKLRRKPSTAVVWQELLIRLAAAAGPTLFGQSLTGADESAGFPLGV